MYQLQHIILTIISILIRKTLILGIPLSTCLRFLIPDVVNKGISKILYLDCDIICHGSLSELIDINLEGEIAGVILDSPDMQKKSKTIRLWGGF